jgi:hypothetical protein
MCSFASSVIAELKVILFVLSSNELALYRTSFRNSSLFERFSAYFPYFEKNKKGLVYRVSVCVPLCLSMSVNSPDFRVYETTSLSLSLFVYAP